MQSTLAIASPDRQVTRWNQLCKAGHRDKRSSSGDLRGLAVDLARGLGRRVDDVVIHDLRHTAVTVWALLGMPQEIAIKASGQKSLAMYYRYVNLDGKHVKEAFKLFTQRLHKKKLASLIL